MRIRCRKVRKLIEVMPKGASEESQRLVSEHLSECQVCRELHDGLQKMDEVLTGSKLWLDEFAQKNPMSKNQIPSPTMPESVTRRWRARPVWAYAALMLLLAVAVVVVYFQRDSVEDTRKAEDSPSALKVTRAMVETASSQTLNELVEAASRHEAPFLEPSHKQSSVLKDPYIPRLLQECRLRSGDTLRAFAQSSTDILTRGEQ